MPPRTAVPSGIRSAQMWPITGCSGVREVCIPVSVRCSLDACGWTHLFLRRLCRRGNGAFTRRSSLELSSGLDPRPYARGITVIRRFIPSPVLSSLHVRMLAKGDMNDASFIRWHRLERHRPARARDLTGNPLCQADQRLLAANAIALDIDHDARPLADPLVAQKIDHVLELGEVISPTADEHAQIAAENVDEDCWWIVRGERHG